MSQVASLAQTSMVGRLEYESLNIMDFLEWIHFNWRPLVKYAPKLSIIVNGSYHFHFLSSNHNERILSKPWIIGEGLLVLGMWHMNFNLE